MNDVASVSRAVDIVVFESEWYLPLTSTLNFLFSAKGVCRRGGGAGALPRQNSTLRFLRLLLK